MELGVQKEACIGCHTAKYSPKLAFDPYLKAIRCDRGKEGS
jgi:hypothetical protein